MDLSLLCVNREQGSRLQWVWLSDYFTQTSGIWKESLRKSIPALEWAASNAHWVQRGRGPRSRSVPPLRGTFVVITLCRVSSADLKHNGTRLFIVSWLLFHPVSLGHHSRSHCLSQFFYSIEFSMEWMYHNLFNPSLIGGHLGCFQHFAITTLPWTLGAHVQVYLGDRFLQV